MALFGLFGKKPEQPAQPISGGIETGIPAGAPQQPSNPNTLGGLMPTPPAGEQQPVATGDIEETKTWAAAKSALDAERTAATVSLTPVASTPPMGTFGATPTPEAIASAQTEEVTLPPAAPEPTLVSSPSKAPAEQFTPPVAEITETTAPDTGPSDEPTAETQVPVLPVSETITPPPAFSMDAINAPQPETPVLSAEPTDGEVSPTNPNLTETPSATVNPEPVSDTTPPLPVEPMTHEVATAPE